MGKIIGLDGAPIPTNHDMSDEEFAEVVAGRFVEFFTHDLSEHKIGDSPNASKEQLNWMYDRLVHLFKLQKPLDPPKDAG